MGTLWRWQTADSRWSVQLDEARGVLVWRGEDLPRPGVRGSELAGGERDQLLGDLRASGRGAYPCPDEILAALREVAAAWPASPA
jgi:hypothetical protein